MFRRLVREYLSLTRAERRGMQFLGILLLFLLLLRGSIPLLIHSPVRGIALPGEDFNAFRDSLQKLDAWLAGSGYSKSGPGSFDVYAESFPSDREPFPLDPESFQNNPETFPFDPKTYRSDPETFPFDPNMVGFDELVRLGLSPGTARILLNYRTAGGSFGRDSDLLKVYGLHPDEFRRLQPCIRINPHGSFELNGADSMQLVSVFGIGPVFARRIIRYRQMLGGFCRPEQLMEVYGLNLQQYEELMRCSYLDTSLLRKIDLNCLDAETLSLHPYLDRYQARSLVAYREEMGAFRDPLEVLNNRLLPDSVYLRIRPYLDVNR
jgi:competence protein ComEA